MNFVFYVVFLLCCMVWPFRMARNKSHIVIVSVKEHDKNHGMLQLYVIINNALLKTWIIQWIFYLDSHAWIIFLTGSICLIPGAYHFFYVVCILTGRKGYEWRNLPTFA
ncbi:unnamed protein product [Soboliphyme baturini]|uniref:XK-related protein n=1 Tax=Soboliphyme baturini TaxID=241478 RepID=A0A183IYY7_9BILA|nr:unnamed protein product [Soboliphyme baturini]